MNEDRALVLFRAITDIREEYIEEAALPRIRRVTLPRLAGLAAACFLLLAGGTYLLAVLGVVPLGPAAGGGSSKEKGSFMYYAGPILPLTAPEGTELAAARCVTLDFTGYSGASPSPYVRKITVIDEYLLTNPTGEDRSYTLYYPVVTSPQEEGLPAVTLDGMPVETECILGPGTNRQGRAPRLNDWEDYKAWLEDGYLDRALAEPPSLDIPVVVYELRDRWGERSEDVKNPTLNMEFTIDRAKTAVLTFGFNGGTNDLATGMCQRHCSVPRKGARGDGQSAWLLVLGEDIGDYTLRAYTDGSCTVPTEEAGGTVVRYASTLGEMVRQLHLLSQELEEAATVGMPPETAEEIRRSAAAAGLIAAHWREIGLLEGNYTRFWQSADGSLEEEFNRLRDRRVLYVRFTLHIPAGESRRLTVTAPKHPSYDFSGTQRDLRRNGYDLTPRLGSPLAFTQQEAMLEGWEYIIILDQNFGFDPEKGVLQVTLDPAVEHYFIEVDAKKQK